MSMKKIGLVILILFTGCYKVSNDITPNISYSVEEMYLNSLPSFFSDINDYADDWANEIKIGISFAKEEDFYRAITSFKRALVILPKEQVDLNKRLQYAIVFAYYLAHRYDELINFFEKSDITNVDKTFKPFQDLLIILHDSYRKKKDVVKEENIKDMMIEFYPNIVKSVSLSTALLDAKIDEVKNICKEPDYYSPNKNVINNIDFYEQNKKSIGKAQFLNAICPGTGYLYIGQKRSFITAFLINSLFISASYEFFHHGYTAAGIISASIEAGWYFGGIYGAGEETKYYNERLYDSQVASFMNQSGLFPVYMIKFYF